MSALASAITSRRAQRWLPWIGGLVLLAGIIAALVAFVGNTAPDQSLPLRSAPPAIDKPQAKVPLTKEARFVAGRFILTAVARKHLAEAWTLTAPSLRAGVTYKQWLRGEMPVVPYPVDELRIAPMKVDYSYRNKALVEVALLPKKGTKVRPQIFFLGMHAVGTGAKRRWLVDYWAPRAAAGVPQNMGGA